MMNRREWFFWGYVIWLVFGLIGVAIVLAPSRMGIADPPSWWALILGFVGGLLFFVVLEVRKQKG